MDCIATPWLEGASGILCMITLNAARLRNKSEQQKLHHETMR